MVQRGQVGFSIWCTKLTRNNRPPQMRRYLGPPLDSQLDLGASYNFADHLRSCSIVDKTDLQTVPPFLLRTRMHGDVVSQRYDMGSDKPLTVR